MVDNLNNESGPSEHENNAEVFNTPSSELAPEKVELVNRPISEHPLAIVFRYLYEIIKTIVIVIIMYLLIRTFIFQPFEVDGSSMEPTLHNNEFLLVQKVTSYFKDIQRGDVIVFRYPNDPKVSYVKRIVGLPGDKVAISQGKVTIYNSQTPNGLVLDENYLVQGQQTRVNNDYSEHDWTVGANEYFVMGDNRDHSDDSRSWNFVPKSNIIGQVWLTVYPIKDFGTVEKVSY